MLLRLLGAALLLAGMSAAGVGWHYSGEILAAPPARRDAAVPPRAPVPVDDVAVPGPLGSYPAWLADPDPAVREPLWAVYVHGRGADRSDCAAVLPTLLAAGLPTLCVSYRNDPGAPPDPRGLYRQGDAEADDVSAALDYAAASGAQRFVLVGWSMGAQITANVARDSDHAGAVAALVWDSPLLDWGPAIAAGAEARGVPSWLVPLGMFASELRAGVSYDALNQVANAAAFQAPILLFHGTADRTVPVDQSDRFAAARPGLVRYRRLRAVGHVAGRAVAPDRYDRELRDFLEPLAGDSAAALRP